ncbi:MAG: glycosyltransferase [Desulfomonile tiedjei]|nr:glycosyltransferase [Desulfomonile tiedjei]
MSQHPDPTNPSPCPPPLGRGDSESHPLPPGEGEGEGSRVHNRTTNWGQSTVDIIIPCYNTGRYLRQAIDSALAQTYPRINVLVVDDGSTDNTSEIVKSYEGRVGYFYQENKGLPAARNIGITRTHGDLICLLDADDVVLPHMMQDQVEEFEKDARVDIAHGRTLAFDNDDLAHPYAEVWRPHREWHDYVEPLSVICAVHLGSSLIRRSCFQRFGLFTQGLAEQGCEDWAFWLNCALHGAVFRHVPRVHGLYRQHAGSMSSSEPAIARRESELIKLAANMFSKSGVTDSRRLKVLSCGIKSIAARWLALGEPEKFGELLALCEDVSSSSGKDMQTDDAFPYSAETPPSLIYLALSKQFLDLGLEDLAAVMFIKCGDIRMLGYECGRCQQSELFEQVVVALAAAAPTSEIRHPSEPNGISAAIRVGARHASPLRGSAEFYLDLERMIPHHASFHSYVKRQFGFLEERRGEIDKAEKDLRDSVSLNPNRSHAHVDLGWVLHIKGDYTGAENELKIAIALDPEGFFAHYDLARTLDAKGDYVGAEQELRICLALDPTYVLARLDHAKAMAKMGKYSQAVVEFLKTSRDDPKAGKDYLIGWFKSMLGKRPAKIAPR